MVVTFCTILLTMERVQTLLISDSLVKANSDGSPFRFSHDLLFQSDVLRSYDKRAPTLRRAAFTTELEWEKRTDGWHVC